MKGSTVVCIGMDEIYPVYSTVPPSTPTDKTYRLTDKFLERLRKAEEEYENVQKILEGLYRKEKIEWLFH